MPALRRVRYQIAWVVLGIAGNCAMPSALGRIDGGIQGGSVLGSGVAASPDCPKTWAEWAKWKRQNVDAAVAVELIYTPLTMVLHDCAKLPEQQQFFTNSRFDACLGPAIRFFDFDRTTDDDHQSGFDRSDSSYVDPQRLDYPKMLELPDAFKDPDFLNAVQPPEASREQVATALARVVAKIPGAAAVRVPSPINGGGGDEYMIRIPGPGTPLPAYTQWVHFIRSANVGSGGDTGGRPHGIDDFQIATRQNADAQGRPLTNPITRFSDFDVARDSPHATKSTGGHNLSSCKLCHRTGLMPWCRRIPIMTKKIPSS